MSDHGRAGDGAVAQNDVDEAGRQTGADRELRKVDSRERRHFRGFQHHRIACRERGAELPGGHGNGKVPGRDGTDDAIGLGHDHAEIAVVGWHEIASLLVGEFGEETDLFGADRNVAGDEMTNGPG